MTTAPDCSAPVVEPDPASGLTVFTVTEIRTTTVRVEAMDRQHAREVAQDVITAARESLESTTRWEVSAG